MGRSRQAPKGRRRSSPNSSVLERFQGFAHAVVKEAHGDSGNQVGRIGGQIGGGGWIG